MNSPLDLTLWRGADQQLALADGKRLLPTLFASCSPFTVFFHQLFYPQKFDLSENPKSLRLHAVFSSLQGSGREYNCRFRQSLLIYSLANTTVQVQVSKDLVWHQEANHAVQCHHLLLSTITRMRKGMVMRASNQGQRRL